MPTLPSTIVWHRSGREFALAAADEVGALLTEKPDAAIALPTGHTPLGMYAALLERSAAKQLSLARARYFNLDDYVGLPPDHPLSYARFLRQQFLIPAGVPAEHAQLLNGKASDLEAECLHYDSAIASGGGLDLAILGLGPNGHIGFNEPGSDWSASTHVVALSAETRAMHAAQTQAKFPIPNFGITMGIATIFAARKILLLVAGGAKVNALAALRRAKPDSAWPVTALLTHRNLKVLSEAELASASAPAGGSTSAL